MVSVSGFTSAPVTKGLWFTCLFSSLYGMRRTLSVAPFPSSFSEWLLNQFAFASLPQTLVSLLLLYHFRQLERLLGSSKFGAFLSFSWLFGLSTHVSITVLLPSLPISPGPFSTLFALLPLFARLLPPRSPQVSHLLGIPLSDKTLFYLLSLQLSLSDGLSSLLPALWGVGGGVLYLANVLNLQAFRLPPFLAKPLAAILHPLLVSPPPPLAGPGGGEGRGIGGEGRGGIGGMGGEGRGGTVERRPEPRPDPDPVVPPSEENIESLMNLGFSREEAVGALERFSDNLEHAANFLFSQS